MHSLLIKDNVESIILLKDEKEEFPELISNIKIILEKINKRKFVFREEYLKDLNNLDLNTNALLCHITPLDANIKNKKLILLDEGNPSGRYQFLKTYFLSNDFNFSEKAFKELTKRKNISIFNMIKHLFIRYSLGTIIQSLFLHITKYLFSSFNLYKKNISPRYCSYYKKSSVYLKNFKYVYEKLGDEKSKKIYKNAIFGSAEENWKEYFNRIQNQIKYSDYVKLDKTSVIINCGINDAFEIPFYISKKVSQIYNIDPTGDKWLNDYTKDFIKKGSSELFFIKKAIYNSQEVYDANLYNSSRANYRDTDKSFGISTIPEIILEKNIAKIDLIKSDVGGAERFMVKDLIAICKKFRPQLSIAIYYSNLSFNKFILNDTVEIPMQLMEKIKDYNFYISHYSYGRWDIIFHCIPKEKI